MNIAAFRGYTGELKILAPLLNKHYWKKVVSMEIKYIKSAVRFLNRDWVNKEGLDLSLYSLEKSKPPKLT